MSSTLRAIGFVAARHGEAIVFTHPDGGPTILLPAYKNGQSVRPIHRAMVKKQLTDAGMLEPGQDLFPARRVGASNPNPSINPERRSKGDSRSHR